jgi:4-hydroxy-4-methyl-2-oxoglutarate aldolase
MTALLSRDVVLTAAGLGAASLHEAGRQIGALPSRIRPIGPAAGPALAGPAFPVQCPAGDNLRLHHAIVAARPGDVLVVDTGGALEYGYWGEVMSAAALERGIAGLVIDGGVRDTAVLRGSTFRVFASNVCIRGTGKDPALPGGVGVPVLLGGVRVALGDLVVADADGVLVLPAEDAPDIVERGVARVADEIDYLRRLRSGASTLEIYHLPANGLG